MTHPIDGDVGPLERTLGILHSEIRGVAALGAQVAVSMNGRVVADFAVGQARPGVPMGRSTVMLWLSSGKPAAAVAIAQLWEAGRLTLDAYVADIIPEFAAGGKARITVRHLLTHTGGFRLVEPGWPMAEWDESIARICAAPIDAGWIPGRRAGYHPQSSWFILGEIVRRLTGEPYDRYVRRAIFEPLDLLDTWAAMPADRFQAEQGRLGDVFAVTPHGIEPHPQHQNTAERCRHARPGGSTRGPLRELARFYTMLLNGGHLEGARILTPQSVEALTAPHRIGMKDVTFGRVLDWGLGFTVCPHRYSNDPIPYGFGRHASPRAFGHGGAQSSIGFADPEHGLAAAWILNGLPGEEPHRLRNDALNTSIYEDLGLAA